MGALLVARRRRVRAGLAEQRPGQPGADLGRVLLLDELGRAELLREVVEAERRVPARSYASRSPSLSMKST